ncbi:MAG: diguanylate cyclase [Coriobacteriales bacterium]|nr:diguanylate cyclase [Coriobacteriales bacterium]
MKQLTYVLNDSLTTEQMDRMVAEDPAFVHASARLLIVFEPHSDFQTMRERIRVGSELLPNTTIVGMTIMGSVGANAKMPKHAVCTFLLFEESQVHMDVYDCNHMTPREAGRHLAHKLDSYEHKRAILCMPTQVGLNPAPFVNEVTRAHGELPLFGAQAGINTLTNGRSVVFTGDELYERGILTVTFCGENLQVKPTYNLGWRAIGNDHVITSCTNSGRVGTIDDKPAVSLYQRYLKISLDDNFFDNVSPFPLVLRSGKELVARVPTGFYEDGSLQFPVAFERGSHVFFSYAHPTVLLRETSISANEMAMFMPQALVMFACSNRRVFLGNDRADYEVACYVHACESMAWAYGNGEIMHTAEGGGLLNSTIVALGMREGEPTGTPPKSLPDPVLVTGGRPIPLSERLATFLDATTAEANATIGELEVLAKRDPLTGAFNRRRMDEILHYEMSKRRRSNDLVLLMYDIDWFKNVNDTYGHDTGDVVLMDLTRCVQSCIREGDTLGRWGGEEFLCLLTELTMEQAYAAAERIRKRVEQTNFLRVGHITISIGLTDARENDTAETFFQRVDQALYDAKHAGRNCTCVR